MIIINCKNYALAKGRLERTASHAAALSKRYGVEVAVAPPAHMIPCVAGLGVRVFAQHADDVGPGSTTGHASPDLLKKAGVSGSLINHSEHRIGHPAISGTVKRLRGLGMTSVVCARNVSEVRRYAMLRPDFVAIEPPDLIGSGRAISKERPGLVSGSAKALASADAAAGLLCGAGIVSSADVSRAVELGARGILVASGIVRARNWRRTLESFAQAMQRPGRL